MDSVRPRSHGRLSRVSRIAGVHQSRRRADGADRPAADHRRGKRIPMTGEVERIADAVLFEGYVLYPYRASSGKNRMRWQFGVVAPASPSGDGEPSRFETECVVEPGRMPVLHARLRFLHLRTRQIEAGGTTSSWDEGEVRVCDLPVVSLAALPITSETPVVIPGHTDQDRRVAQPLTARVTVRARSAGAYVVVGVAVENLAPWELAFEAD